jgi:hypothetical protein
VKKFFLPGWNFQLLRVLGSTLKMKAEANSSSRGQKDFICREEIKKAAWGHAARPGNWWSRGSGWKLGFCIAQGRRCLSGANRHFLGRRSVSLANYQLLEPPAVCSLLIDTWIWHFYVFYGTDNIKKN